MQISDKENRDKYQEHHAEGTLPESEERFRSLFENMLDGFAYCKMLFDGSIAQDFIYLNVNQAFERLTGLKHVVGKKVTEVIPGFRESARELLEIYGRVAATGNPERFEYYLDTLGIWFSISAYSPQRGYFVSVFDNITESKRAKAALEQSEERFRTMADFTHDWEYWIGPDETIVYVSPSCERVTGYSPDKFIQDPELIRRLIHPEDRNMIEPHFLHMDKTLDSCSIDFRIQMRNGETRWINHMCRSVFGSRGEWRGRRVTNRDITTWKQADFALRNSEELYRSLISASPDAITVTDLDGCIVYLSPTALTMFGHASAEEVIGRNVMEWVAPEDRKLATENIQHLFAKGYPKNREYSMLTKDGSGFKGEVNAAIVRSAQNIPTGMIIMTRDITQRKQAEEQLHVRDIAVKSSISAMALADLNGKLIFANEAFLRLWKYDSEQEVLEKHIPDFSASKELVEEVMRSISSGIAFVGEGTVIGKDLVPFDVQIHANMVKAPDGTPMCLMASFIDITERRKAERALRESEKKYKNFFEEDLTGDYITTPSGRILSCNAAFARMFGFSSSEAALSVNAAGLYRNAQDYAQLLERLHEEKKLEYCELEMRSLDGKTLDIVANIFGRFDSANRLIEIKGYLFDDTRRRSLEQQLIQAQKLEGLGTLASGIAHDFNNLLGIIMGHSFLLNHVKHEPEKFSESVDAITCACERGASVVRQLLTFARKSEVKLEPLQVNGVIIELTRLLHETFPKTIVVNTDLQENLPLVEADAIQIHQVILNLCVNARDAMNEGGTLLVSTRTISGEILAANNPQAENVEYVAIEVKDSGTGMDEATRQRIFEPFFTTKELGKGTGLGLALAYGIIQSHRGFIQVSSQPGDGTVFQIHLPVHQQGFATQATEKPLRANLPGGKETILVIEDERAIRDSLKSILIMNGYRVLTASDGEKGILTFREHQKEIALVVSDMGLPKLGGEGVFRGIKALNPQAMIILASGFLDPKLKSELSAEGALHFVQKPFSLFDMLKKIREVIDSNP